MGIVTANTYHHSVVIMVVLIFAFFLLHTSHKINEI